MDKKRNFSFLKIPILALVILALAGVAYWYFNKSSGSVDSKYSFELIPVKSGENWGYIDTKGNYVINPQYKTAALFQQGLALVQDSNENYGFIDKSGKYVIEPKYVSATSFSEGYAFVTPFNGFITCIDKNGKEMFVLKDIDKVYEFKDGFARVVKDFKEGFVDGTGKLVINPVYYGVGDFSESLAVIIIDENAKENEDQEHPDPLLKYGYIDKTGKIIINPQFEFADDFSEGLAVVRSGNKVGYIDKTGKFVINPQFESASSFREGRAVIKETIIDKEKYDVNAGFIDKKGKIIVNMQYDDAHDYKNGLAAINQNGKWGFIDEKGTFVINPQFEEVSDFYIDFTSVKSGKKFGFIDKKGSYKINPQFVDVNFSPDTYRNSNSAEKSFYDTKPLIAELFATGGLLDINTTKTVGSFVTSSFFDKLETIKNKTGGFNLSDKNSINDVNSFTNFYLVEGAVYFAEQYYDSSTPVSRLSYNIGLFGLSMTKAKIVMKALSIEFVKRYGYKVQDESTSVISLKKNQSYISIEANDFGGVTIYFNN